MRKPINQRQENLVKLMQKYELEKEVEKIGFGGEHRPESDRVAQLLEDIDWLYCGDFFGFKFGGDGDNGEVLLGELDIIFTLIEKMGQNDGTPKVDR